MMLTHLVVPLVAVLAGSGWQPPPEPDVVLIPAVDGVVTADVYGAGPRGVVLAHGGRFDRASWRAQATELAAAGFRVVAIDFRAAVETRAGRETPCLYDEACLAKDVLAAVGYLRRTGATDISLVGASLGGAGVARASADSAVGTIDRLVLLAHMPVRLPESMRGAKLFIVAQDDPGPGGAPRLTAIRAQYEKARDPKELMVVAGRAHAQEIFATPEGNRVLREVIRFLTAPTDRLRHRPSPPAPRGGAEAR